MQIHEITRLGKQRTDEGLLDTFKQAVGITPKAGGDASPSLLQKLTNPAIAAVERNKRALKSSRASIEKLKAQGYDVSGAEEALDNYSQAKTPQQAAAKAQDAASILKQAYQEVQQDQAVQSSIDQNAQQFKDDFVTLMPDAGTQLEVKMNNGTYYKTDKGVWVQKETKLRIIKPESIKALDDIIDNGGATQVPAEKPEPVVSPKGSKNKQVKESILYEGRKPLAQQSFEDFVSTRVQGKDDAGHPITFVDVLKNPMIKKRLREIFVKMYKAGNSNPKDEKTMIEAFREYMTTAFAGIKVVNRQRERGDDEYQGDVTGSEEQQLDISDENIVDTLTGVFAKIPRAKRAAAIKQAYNTVKNET